MEAKTCRPESTIRYPRQYFCPTRDSQLSLLLEPAILSKVEEADWLVKSQPHQGVARALAAPEACTIRRVQYSGAPRLGKSHGQPQQQVQQNLCTTKHIHAGYENLLHMLNYWAQAET